MCEKSRPWLLLCCVVGLGTSRWSLGDETTTSAATTPKPAATKPKKQLFRGEVRRIPEVLKQLGIKAYPEELSDQVALLAADDELLPILPDWRGRALFQDERLRDRKVELVGYRRPGLPYLQVLSIYTFDDKDQRMLTDYWCDICSIPMYEIKPCDCCQQPIRLRFQPRDLPKDLAETNK